MKLQLFLLAVVAFVVFSGCISSPASSTCAASDTNCTYSQAVLQQDPYLCYNLPIELREECFKHSTDLLEKKNLQRLQAGFPSPLPAQPALQNQTQPQNPPPQPQTTLQQCASAPDYDACVFAAAQNEISLSLCSQINQQQLRQQCISNVATKTKNPNECSIFTDESEKALCLSYSSG
ncbi:hypothetical protein J4441_04390 [Candidatus Micrarchaeota archaeon]|nr:hypothetical protein [Candidatus Micrarchaeota archaeon]